MLENFLKTNPDVHKAPLNHIFTKETLHGALNEISQNSRGIDEVGFIDFAKNRYKNIEKLLNDLQKGTYAPEPIKSISIAKPNSHERRPIGLGSIKDKISLCIAIAYEKYLSNKTYKDSENKLGKKKNIYAKKFASQTTLHVSSPWLYISLAKNTFSIKEYGKVKQKVPISKVERIILEGKGISFSTNFIKRCAKENIPIDFIDFKLNSYASLVTYKASLSQMIHKQALILGTPLELYLAKSFIKGKAKNQLNFLKYLNKYHESLDIHIKKIQKNIKLIKTTSNKEQLLGYEGSVSALYWDGIRVVLKVDFEKRITLGARDVVNCSLNYAYALLYGCVQHALVQAGLSLNISYLHALDKQKPTLSFDLIEEFRVFMVDRVVVSMLNKDEPLKLGKDGLLTKPSRLLLAKNIKEKLGSYTMWKKTSIKCQNIIQTQAYNLSHSINENKENYKPFIGKF